MIRVWRRGHWFGKWSKVIVQQPGERDPFIDHEFAAHSLIWKNCSLPLQLYDSSTSSLTTQVLLCTTQDGAI